MIWTETEINSPEKETSIVHYQSGSISGNLCAVSIYQKLTIEGICHNDLASRVHEPAIADRKLSFHQIGYCVTVSTLEIAVVLGMK